MWAKVPSRKDKATVVSLLLRRRSVDDLHIDKGHRLFCFIDDLTLDESFALRQGRQRETDAKSEISPSERITVSSNRVLLCSMISGSPSLCYSISTNGDTARLIAGERGELQENMLIHFN